MRKQIIALLAGAMMMVATSAMALTISGGTIDVGGRDTFVDSTDLGNSGDAAELAWVKSILGSGFTWDTKYDTESNDWALTNEARTFAIQFQADAPEYYMIKTGTGANDPINDHFLFKNEASLEWAVLNLDADFGEGYTIKNIGKISHVAEIGGNTPVPEPGTMMLLGMGMLGLAVFGKRRMNKNA